MKNTAVIHMTKCRPSSTLASARIATFIRDQLAVPLYDDMEGLCKLQNLDTVILVNGPSAFCEDGLLETLGELVGECRRFIWCMNDYTIYPPTQVRAVIKEVPIVENWSTVPVMPANFMERKTYQRICSQKNIRYINWNSLTYKPVQIPGEFRPGLFYYGAYRDGRAADFRKYFGPEATYPITISTTKSSAKKFELIHPEITFLPPFINNELPPMASLYIEDRASHETYCSPANRFYECLAAGSPMFFDKATLTTMSKAGLDASPWMVENAEDLYFAIKHPKLLMETATKQRKLWDAPYVDRLAERLKEIANEG